MPDFRTVTADDYNFTEAPVYRKTASLSKSNIEIADKDQEVVTHINGQEETRNTAAKGDFIITGVKGERYVIKAAKFPNLYEVDPENPDIYRSKNVVRGLQVSEPVEITAPWGEKQRTAKGCFIVQAVANPSDVYLIEESAFKATYAAEMTAKRPATPQAKAPTKDKTYG